MKLYVVLLALVALTLAEEVDQASEHKKRGVAKQPASLNSLSSNGHQKPEQLTGYSGFQQQAATQTPLYPLAPPTYSSEPHQPTTHQSMYNFQPQILPLSFFTQPYSMPKYQIIAMKSANGQTQLTLVPQNIYMPQQNYNPSPSFLQVQQPILSNHLSSQPSSQSTSTSYHPPSSQSSYSSSQSQTHGSHTPNTPSFVASQQFYNQQPNYQFGHNPLLGQPSTMFIFAQPAPQLYGNNNYASPQNLLYSQTAQQLLNYYHSNPQAKNQLLYGNSASYPQQTQVNSYQNPITPTEYEKSVPVQVQQSLTSQKNDNDLNTNEYVSQADTQFRPIPSYGARSQTAYKN